MPFVWKDAFLFLAEDALSVFSLGGIMRIGSPTAFLSLTVRRLDCEVPPPHALDRLFLPPLRRTPNVMKVLGRIPPSGRETSLPSSADRERH